jgi:uncharacterized protein (TIGR02646 family)
MKKIKRLLEPECLKKKGKEWGKDFAAKKRENPKYQFSWHQYKNEQVNKILKPVLEEMTQNHCSFCDGYPLGAQSRKTIEHFRPKNAYPLLSYTWANLFLCCDVCQSAKLDKFDKKLLKPDKKDYEFHIYFINNYKNGKILPNPAASEEFQERAKYTIKIYDLNKKERKESRKRTYKDFNKKTKEEQMKEIDDYPYRCFLS